MKKELKKFRNCLDIWGEIKNNHTWQEESKKLIKFYKGILK